MVSYLSLVFIAVFGAAFGLFSFAVYLFTPPRNFPQNIPTIPFYYALLPLFKDVDQAESYRKYLKEPLERYGAVKLFFGGRWNVLVHKPAYISEVFKHEDIYEKSGNQKKIPHALIAEYTGENIISAHGAKWKLYSSVIKPALQSDHDSAPIWRNSRTLRRLFLEQVKASASCVPVVGLLQRHALANLSDVLYESSFETLDRLDAPLDDVQRKIKPIIFNPIFMNFPFLDHFKFLSARQLGRQLNSQFRRVLRASIAKGHTHHTCDAQSKQLACRLFGARNEGQFSEKDLEDNLVSTFLAGHENPQLAMISTMYLLAQHPTIQEQLRKEISTLFPEGCDSSYEPSYSEIHDLPFLTSVLYESLRLFPPISQLINRCPSTPIVLGNRIPIQPGTYLGYNCYSTNRDSEFWGPDADEFKPGRWGSNMEDMNHLYRKVNAKGAFISFHGGKRACLGQKFAMQELRITMVDLVRNLKWRLGEGWVEKMTPAGPLYPRNLKLKFEQLSEATEKV